MDHHDLLTALLPGVVETCRTALGEGGGVLASLALTGVIGGLTHCTTMCGPFVLSQVAARLEATPAARMREWHRLTGAAVLPYHLGRGTTYATMGAVGAALVGRLVDRPALHWLSGALLLFAAAFMLAMALPAARRLLAAEGGRQGWWSRTIGQWARPLFNQPTGWRGYLLGILLGFIPCGFLYGALAAATAGGSLVTGAAGMALFAAATTPGLFAVGLAGHLAGDRWRGPMLRYAPLLLLANAGILTLLAWRHVA